RAVADLQSPHPLQRGRLAQLRPDPARAAGRRARPPDRPDTQRAGRHTAALGDRPGSALGARGCALKGGQHLVGEELDVLERQLLGHPAEVEGAGDGREPQLLAPALDDLDAATGISGDDVAFLDLRLEVAWSLLDPE